MNLKLLSDLLTANGYAAATATSGAEALMILEKDPPDLVLLDVVMPEMGGYEVCQRIRENPKLALLPVVMVSALDPREERVKGIEAGADDFLEKPIRVEELLARVRSLLRIKELHEIVQSQAQELADLNKSLEQRVQDQVAQLDRLGRLRQFFSPLLADKLVSEGAEDVLKSHRRRITVVFIDLRRFTAFAEMGEPEEVMGLLQEFHHEMGRLTVEFQGTLERFTGDGMMVVFNDPLQIANHEEQAVRMAVSMRDSTRRLRVGWDKRGYDVGFGAGIAAGYATLGGIGFEGRLDYTAIGKVTNLAARLCAEALDDHLLVCQQVFAATEPLVEYELFGELSLKGFTRPVPAHNVLRFRP